MGKVDWKHVLSAILWVALMACTGLLLAAEKGDQLPFGITAGGLGTAILVLGYMSRQLVGGQAPGNTNGNARGFAHAALVVLLATIGLVVAALLLSGCMSSAPTVPVTPANQAQVTSCQNTASLHNDVVIGDFVFGGAGAATGGIGAAVTDSNQRAWLAGGAAVASGLVVAGTAIAGFSAKNFANSHCSEVVGDLPALAKPAAGQ